MEKGTWPNEGRITSYSCWPILPPTYRGIVVVVQSVAEFEVAFAFYFTQSMESSYVARS